LIVGKTDTVVYLDVPTCCGVAPADGLAGTRLRGTMCLQNTRSVAEEDPAESAKREAAMPSPEMQEVISELRQRQQARVGQAPPTLDQIRQLRPRSSVAPNVPRMCMWPR
jgi:hypothetical protein